MLPEMEAEMERDNGNRLGQAIKLRRVVIPLTLQKLASAAHVSTSHLGRIERGERFPSASVLRKIAKPLRFSEAELFALAGYLSAEPAGTSEGMAQDTIGKLDPYTAMVLSAELPSVQRAVTGILSILKELAHSKS